MALAIFVSIASVAAGVVLALAPRNGSFVGIIRTFALTAALAVVVLHLLPQAFVRLGALSFLPLGVGLAAPRALEKAGTWIGRVRHGKSPYRKGSVALEAGYYGLLVHSVGDGLGLGAYTGELSTGHPHGDVIIALSAHTVPVVAMMVLVFDSVRGRRSALTRAGVLAIASVAGVVVTAWLPTGDTETSTAWISAIVAGLLVHVVTHGLLEHPPEGNLMRATDAAAAALGVGVSLIGSGAHEHAHEGEMQRRIWNALADLAIETAPVLLIGLPAAALLSVLGSRSQVTFSQRIEAFRVALGGAFVGARSPQHANAVLSAATVLKARGAPQGFVIAFLLAAPALGMETFALSVQFLGWRVTWGRMAGALLLAIAAGFMSAKIAATKSGSTNPRNEPIKPDASPASLRQCFVPAFDDLMHQVAPWMIVGIVAAAFLDVFAPADALNGLQGSWFELAIVSAVSLPAYFCAPAAMPFAAVLVAKGLSPGAVVVGLLVGPTVSLAMFGFLRDAYGARAAVAVGVVAVSTSWLLGLALQVWLPVRDVQTRAVVLAEEHGVAWQAAALLCGVLLLRNLWLSGTRRWIAPLFHFHEHSAHHGDEDRLHDTLTSAHAHR